jgi:two-component system NarL family response regulator
VVREGLTALINRRQDMQVVAEASNGQEAVKQFLLHRPDVALLDLRMAEMDGVDAIAAIRKQVPTARIIVLTTYDHDEDIYRSLQAGARAYLLKDAPREELLACIRTVHAGQTYLPSAIAAKLAHRRNDSALTAREIEVMDLMADGKANKEIAAALRVSEGTVKSHVNAILKKLDAVDRTEAVIIAFRRGIVRVE